jgi:hypothetical protein
MILPFRGIIKRKSPSTIFRGGFKVLWTNPTSFPAEEFLYPAFWLSRFRDYSRRYCTGFTPDLHSESPNLLFDLKIQ